MSEDLQAKWPPLRPDGTSATLFLDKFSNQADKGFRDRLLKADLANTSMVQSEDSSTTIAAEASADAGKPFEPLDRALQGCLARLKAHFATRT